MLTVTDLTVRYDGHDALVGVSLTLPPASTLAVIGPNGSGKSTLLRAVAGLAAPASGTIACASARPALVLQSTDVDRSLPITAFETICMARYPELGLVGRFRRRDRAAVDRAMERLDIENLAQTQLHDLSGGQRQRVLVAQGLAQQSDLLLLDEPVTGLDVTSRATILDVVDEERAAGHAVVMTTHDLDDARRFDQVLLLSGGRPVACGTPDDVIAESPLRAAFGSHVVRLGTGGDVVMDDPHHAH